MRIAYFILLAWLGGVLGMPGRDLPAAPVTLTNIAECLGNIRGRTNPPAPLRVEAVITLVDPERNLIVLQDDSGAMAVHLTLTGLTLKPGQRISIEGSGVFPYVRSFPDYPDQPSGRGYLSSFEVPSNIGDYYVARIRGYLHPPVTGRYTFWIAADDAGEFWLSPDADPARMQKTAALTTGNSTGERDWHRYRSQSSQAVDLKAGEAYYIETLHIQGVGRDSLAVAWEGPGIKLSVIEGRYLTPWPVTSGGATPTNGLLRESWTNFYVRDFQALYARSRRESLVRVPDAKVTVLGEGSFPDPIVPGALLDTVPNFHWVEVEGDVTFAGGVADRLRLELVNGTTALEARVFDWGGQSTARLRDSHVRVRGILVHAYGPFGNITNNVVWVPDGGQVTVLNPVAGREAEAGRVLISEIEPSNPRMSWGRRVQVRGHMVSKAADGTVVIQGPDKYQGFLSDDGTNWVAIGKPVEIGMSNTVLVGLALASHSGEEMATAKYDHLQGWGSHWLGTNINTSRQTGGFNVEGATLTIQGTGLNIWRSADQNYYVYQLLEDAGEVSVRLADLQQNDISAQTGIMIRESLDRGAPSATLLFTPANGTRFQCRRVYGENPVMFLAGSEIRNNSWMKLVRKRNYVSVQGGTNLTIDLNQEADVTGTITWRSGTPILTETSFQMAPTNSPQLLSFRRELPRSISVEDYLAEAQKSSQPYLRGFLDAGDIRGIVTFCDRVFGKGVMFVQGNARGIPLTWANDDFTSAFQVGQLVETDARSVVGQFPVTLNPSRIRVTGWGSMPRPARYSLDLVNSGAGHGNWVEAEGIIRSQGSNGVLNLMGHEGPLAVWVGHADRNASQEYINASVRLRGVLSVESERGTLLLVPSPEFVEIRDEAPPDPFATPVFPIAELSGLNMRPEQLRRMKVAGVVTCVLKKSFYLQDGTGGVYVQLSETPPVQPGDQVEVAGFPGGRDPVVLSDALIRKTGTGPTPVPLQITAREDGGKNFEAVMVRTEAILIEQRNGLEGQVLILQAGPGIIRAVLAGNPLKPDRLPNLQAGSRVAVTGVCNSQAGGEIAGAEESGDQPLAVAFRIWLRTPADVVLLQRPPWWTWKHAVAVLGIFAFGLLVTLLWVRLLRRRVAQRTRELQETMSRLTKETHTSAVLAERNRLAGEIHDGLEQGLTAIMLQLDAVGKVWHKPEEARRYLGMARNMAGFSRADVKLAVWDLKSPLLENTDLGTALTRVASEVSAGNTQVAVKINGRSRPLPPSTEHNLLRIGQEAITNALKHAQPRTIQVTLDYKENELQLAVKDDGCGFVPDTVLNVAKDGHFGLQGIRARALKINAEIKITSEPGKGAHIIVTVPWDGDSTGL